MGKYMIDILNISNPPKISVFITSYNQKHFLTEAIDSVINQSLKPYEILIVDDASSDGSRKLIESYAKQYPGWIKPIYHTHNTGVTQVRIDALSSVTGDYVTYVDGDDRFLPEKLEKEYATLLKNPDASIVFSNNYYMDADGKHTDIWIENEQPPQGNVFFQTFSRLFPKESLYRMEMVDYHAWRKVGFHEPDLPIYEDFDMRIRMTRQLRVCYCDEPLSEIRFHGIGLSSLSAAMHLECLDYVYQKNRYLLQDIASTDRKIAERRFRILTNSTAARIQREMRSKCPEKQNNKKGGKITKANAKYLSNSYLGDNLIFLISQPRAGSTLLQRMLASHSEIHTTAEPWIMLHPVHALKSGGIQADYRSDLARKGLQDFLSPIPEGEALYIEALRGMSSLLYGRHLELSAKRFFLDKTPRYYQIIPELHRLFPKAHFIFIFRNPVAVLSSTLKTWLNNDPKRIDPATRRDLFDAPMLLLKGIRSLKRSAIVVNYEDLVNYPEEEMHRICSRLGLSYQERMLRYGMQPAPSGSFGDPETIHRHHQPVQAYITKWITNLSSLELLDYADHYIRSFEPRVISGLGYSQLQIIDVLNGQKDKLRRASENTAASDKLVHSSESLIQEGRLEEAKQLLEQGIETLSGNAALHNNLGIVAYRLGQIDQAVDCYRTAARIESFNRIYQKNLADALVVGKGVYDEPMRIYRDLLVEDPGDTEVLTAITYVCLACEKPEDARTFVERALQIEPDDPKIQALMQIVLKQVNASLYACPTSVPDPHTISINGPGSPDLPCCNDSDISFSKAVSRIRVSAVVSTYASERFMEGRLQNLTEQSLYQRGEMEIIVVDADSPENERSIVERFIAKHPEIYYIRAHERETVYASWNRGIQAARGDYFVNANTDDRFAEDALERLADALDANPEYDAAYGDWLVTTVENDTMTSRTAKTRFIYPTFFPPLLFYLHIGTHANFIRRAAIDSIGFFDARMRVFGDRDFFFRFCADGRKATKVDAVVGLYLENPSSLARSDQTILKTEWQPLFRTYLEPDRFVTLFGRNDIPDSKTVASLYVQAGCLGKNLWEKDGRSTSSLAPPLQFFSRAIAHDPSNAVALNNMGIYGRHGGEGLSFFKAALKVASPSMEAKVKENIGLCKKGEENFDHYHFLVHSDNPSFRVIQQSLHPHTDSERRSRIRVSAVVSTYASERFMEGRLQNLTEQSLYQRGEMEIIVVDADSPENERSIVERFIAKHPEIYYIRAHERETVYASWNRGIQAARGDYFVNANTDDRFAEDALERLADALDANPEYDAAYGDWLVTTVENDDFDSVTAKRFFRYPEFHPFLLFYLQVTTHATFVRKSIFDRIGLFDGSFTVFGDRDFLFRIAAQGCKAIKLNQIVGLYLKNPMSVEHSNREKGFRECSSLYDRFLNPEVFARLAGLGKTFDSVLLSDAFTKAGCLGMGLYQIDGQTFHALGSPTRLFSKAIELNPKNVEALNNMGVVAEHREAHQDAVRFFKAAEELADESQRKTIVQNHKRAQRGEKDPGRLDFLFPEGYQPIQVIEEEFNTSGFGKLVSPKLSSKVETAKHMTTDTIIMRSVSIIVILAGSSKRFKTIRKNLVANPDLVKEVFWVAHCRQKKAIRKHLKAEGPFVESIIDLSTSDTPGQMLNRLVTRSSGTTIVVLRDHVQLEFDSIRQLISCRQGIHLPGVSGPLCTNTDIEKQKWQEDSGLSLKHLADVFRNRLLPTNHLDDSVFVFDRGCLIGRIPFDERFRSLSVMLKDFCRRLTTSGYQNFIAADRASFSDSPEKSRCVWGSETAVLDDNALFQKKWEPHDTSTPTGKKYASLSWLERADTNYQEGNLEDSITAAGKAISADPDNWPAYSQLLDSLTAFGPIQEIPECFRSLEKRDDLPPFMLALIGLAYEGVEDFRKAHHFAGLAIEKDRESGQASNLMGILKYRERDPETAEKHFRQAIAQRPDWGDPWTNLGSLLWDQNQTEEAFDCFERGFALTPTAPNIASAYHAAVSSMGRYKRAYPFFNEAVRRYPKFRQASYFLVDVLIHLEDWTSSMSEIERLLIRFGSDPHMFDAAHVIRNKIGPMEINCRSENRPSVSLCMIVKDEEKHLSRCLASLKPIVDEIIVVDTGSTDSTKHIASIFGAKVFDFKWNNDFAAARNYSLQKATGDWILVMDADEVISKKDYGSFRSIIQGSKLPFPAYSIVTRNYTRQCNTIGWVTNKGDYQKEEAGFGWTPSEKVRLFRRDPDIRFSFPVHEVVSPSLEAKGVAIHQCEIPVHHYGRLDTVQLKDKGKKYLEMGLVKLDQMGNDETALRELAVEAGIQGQYQTAIDLWHRLIVLQGDKPKTHINLSTMNARLKRFDMAVHHARMAVTLDTSIKEGHFNLAMGELHLGRAKEASIRFDHLIAIHPDYYPAIFMSAAAHCCAGNLANAERRLKELATTPYSRTLIHAVSQLRSDLTDAGQEDYTGRLIEWEANLRAAQPSPESVQ
ncbi:MAG: glycosyltransferase [Desulfobacterales bacterium]